MKVGHFALGFESKKDYVPEAKFNCSIYILYFEFQFRIWNWTKLKF